MIWSRAKVCLLNMKFDPCGSAHRFSYKSKAMPDFSTRPIFFLTTTSTSGQQYDPASRTSQLDNTLLLRIHRLPRLFQTTIFTRYHRGRHRQTQEKKSHTAHIPSTLKMAHIPATSTSSGAHTWINASNMDNPQEALDYFSQPDSALSSAEMPSLDPCSGDEQCNLPQVSSPNNYADTPSPLSYPPSPLAAASSHQSGLPLVYLGLNTSSSPSSVAPLSFCSPYPNPLLESSVFDDLGLNSGRYALATAAMDPSMALNSARPDLARTAPLGGYDERRIRVPGSDVSSSFAEQWSNEMYKHQGEQQMLMPTVGDGIMQDARAYDHAHVQHGSIDFRSHSHWHPYNRSHNHTPQQSNSLECFSIRQLSAPPSPVMSSSSSSVSTVGSPAWLPTSPHRRTASVGHLQADEFDRRYSESDLMGQLVPDFSMSLSFMSPDSASPSSRPSQTIIEGMALSSSASANASTATATTTSSTATSGSGVVYKCEYEGCTKTFSRPYNLNSHIRTHTNLRPYHCDHCDRQFARLHDKNRHERLHRGVRPFACERCQHHFARMDALNRHLKVEGGRNLCNMYLIQINSPNAMPLVDLPPKKINPLILAHCPNFGQEQGSEHTPAAEHD